MKRGIRTLAGHHPKVFWAGISLFSLLLYSLLRVAFGLGGVPATPTLPNIPIPDLLRPSPAVAAIAQIAQQVTLRVLAEPGGGSGVLVGRQGSTYVVLTCEHVIAGKADRYTILTADGVRHPAQRLSGTSLDNLDLALLTFESSTVYQPVRLGDDRSLAIGTSVYAAGFPNYHFLPDQNLIQDTRDEGTKAYTLTTGEFSMRLDRALPGGYRLGYTNEVEQGMSGGPVLNASGQLVGINGRLKYPLQGINAYTFSDGTHPSQPLFQQMEALSWAVPTTSFQQTIEQVIQP